MKKTLLVPVLAAAALAVAVPSLAQAVVGQPAPGLTLADSNGKSHSLSEFKGKVVVLEWWNNECPFVRKHYGSGNMQRLQKEWTAKGVAWLAVSSSAAGKQGYVDGAKANALMAETGAAPTAVLLDHDGKNPGKSDRCITSTRTNHQGTHLIKRCKSRRKEKKGHP